MPRVRVPVRRSGVRYTTRPGRRYPTGPSVRPVPAPAAGGRGIAGLIGGLGGALLCCLCLATMALLGLFAAFVAVTAYLADVFQILDKATSAAAIPSVNMMILLGVVFFAGFFKLRRSL